MNVGLHFPFDVNIIFEWTLKYLMHTIVNFFNLCYLNLACLPFSPAIIIQSEKTYSWCFHRQEEGWVRCVYLSPAGSQRCPGEERHGYQQNASYQAVTEEHYLHVCHGHLWKRNESFCLHMQNISLVENTTAHHPHNLIFHLIIRIKTLT